MLPSEVFAAAECVFSLKKLKLMESAGTFELMSNHLGTLTSCQRVFNLYLLLPARNKVLEGMRS